MLYAKYWVRMSSKGAVFHERLRFDFAFLQVVMKNCSGKSCQRFGKKTLLRTKTSPKRQTMSAIALFGENTT